MNKKNMNKKKKKCRPSLIGKCIKCGLQNVSNTGHCDKDLSYPYHIVTEYKLVCSVKGKKYNPTQTAKKNYYGPDYCPICGLEIGKNDE
ncbi:MAG: hypothetical protein KJ886_02050 [Candidatus Thermoplasmatota archaeon]|nr:hypothetical protein [Candidatus Thermoplasmatota archaeon]MBU4256637.1 hypothetical protein [Candidatus Thermoplasmatota archaeon]MCG2826514.1 hypothetical protein [Thermoplasmatales archaeon]